ncbi:BPTI/Kunitz domain-containing protein [Corythoichthys intestinalis]|uniref:BPTI/Kunitz domain-containing protein n=1 Tax=Corythoichthys intestinalis TaxID=161448 RepID=UPI0025A595DF|nr:BPTI/Kunitz domain-containing protein [Corythoichthys intestinalis]XP_057693371.1 BPTI/Kunitz domain-containing protein [Corythoichthys intestinalis]XP_057693372.1 BPTI/Kunitz domain-containing protein [Corythoichthys intestinalis]XP_061812554.1 boophilin-G2-like [Nerophis lumbriciformis]
MKHLLLFAVFLATFHIVHSDIPEFCQLPESEGDGEKFIIALFYDINKDMCSPFIYKGQGGNENRFLNERDCMRNCSANLEKSYPKDATAMCILPKLEGGCNGKFLRYYYNSVYGKCKKFLWTGCHGNGNRFFDHDSCNSTCAGIFDNREEEEEDEPDTPIAIICGVLLGVIILSIFITVIVLTVQSKNKQKMSSKSKDEQPDAPLRGIEMA